MARVLPALASKLTTHFGAWVVGSGANPDAKEFPRDLDLVVPFHAWHLAAQLIPRDAAVNSFGGWKFDDEGVSVDVWPADLASLMTNPLVCHLWQPATGARFSRTEDCGVPWTNRFGTKVQQKNDDEIRRVLMQK